MSTIQKYIEDFGKVQSTGITWLDHARTTSFDRFQKNGFPTQRLEEWKDTNLTGISNAYFPTSGQKSKSKKKTEGFWKKFPHIIFTNGFCESISVSIPDVSVNNVIDGMKDAYESVKSTFETHFQYDHPILDLNTSLAREGVLIHVGKNVNVSEPIFLVYESEDSDRAHYYRNLIIAESFSSVKIVEIFLSEKSSHWSVPVTQIYAGINTSVEHIKIQDEHESVFHTGSILGKQEDHSKLSMYSFSFGGKTVRNDVTIQLNGEGAECVMDGLYVASGTQVMDHHTSVVHAKPHGTSSETYRGILMDESHGIFEGKIVVEEHAIKTDAKQMNQNLLLSSQAKINTAPQLNILADDVKCSHGATIGKLDEDQVFYMRSRGIPLKECKQLLVSAYASQIIERVSIPSVVDELQKKLSDKIGTL